MLLEDFNYDLPDDLIATQPPLIRGTSRLLVVGDNEFKDDSFDHIINYLQAGDLLVLNDSKVIKARLLCHKITGGHVEIMLERIVNHNTIIAHVRTSKKITVGLHIVAPNNVVFEVTELCDGLFQLCVNSAIDLYQYFEDYGLLPLPPYMKREQDDSDNERYQTVYANLLGSVAAPTAGLHFTQELMDKIIAKDIKIAYVTLHVGSGTFKPVSVENVADHKMHKELYFISQTTIDLIKQTKHNGKSVIAVGTTSLRTLESAAIYGLIPHSNDTDIFITPGFHFRLVDKLITNFHLPKSTLLMLVSAFTSLELIQETYKHAIAHNYRFFSYGDAMLLTCHHNQELC